jgi:hypothetical protein
MSANDLLMGTGVPSAKFATPGDSVVGQIAQPPEQQQQQEFGTGRPLTWDDGSPRWQIKVVLQTEQRDPARQFDDGRRAVYLKGAVKRPSILKAVRDAVQASGAPGLEVGGTLEITYTGDDYSSTATIKPKLYAARYTRPSAAAGSLTGLLAGGGDALHAQQQQLAQPAVEASPPGIDPGMWARLDPGQRAAVAAAAGVQANEPPF